LAERVCQETALAAESSDIGCSEQGGQGRQ